MSQQQSSNTQVLVFIISLSFVCALILSVLASALEEPKEIAKELDRSKQMMIAARILTHEGYFQIQNDEGEYIPAKMEESGYLVAGTKEDMATQSDLLEIFKKRLQAFLVTDKGEIVTFEKAGVDKDTYIAKYKKEGYYTQPYKLIYEIYPNDKVEENKTPTGYVIPVNGFGLWDAIYGYIAIKPDGDTVVGISWYDQKETPGLGANITEESWQENFFGKKIFQEGPTGGYDTKTSPIGIIVVKGKVNEVLGNIPKAKSAVDGMPGATLTGNGVTEAYKDVLGAYRPFFAKINKSKN